ncbi:hypothetical protein ATE59_14195 [Sphingopyxis sp. A083]|nr:hypothetical protein ATE59_14195 [Sphingopyxis sp. A083]
MLFRPIGRYQNKLLPIYASQQSYLTRSFQLTDNIRSFGQNGLVSFEQSLVAHLLFVAVR